MTTGDRTETAMTVGTSGAERAGQDPFGSEVAADTHGYLRSVRSEQPVCPFGDGHTYLVTGYDQVVSVMRSPQLFSSQAGKTAAMVKAGLVTIYPELAELGSQFITTEPTLQKADPPEHTGSRRAVSRWFTARRVREDWSPIIDRNVEQLFADLPSGEPVEFVSAIGTPLPIRIIADILGVRPDRHGDLKRWSDVYVSHAGRRPTKEQAMAQVDAHHEMQDFFMAELVERQSYGRGDLMSHLVALLPERNPDAPSTDQLTITQSLDIVVQLVVAGNETTTQFLGDLVELLARHPEQMKRAQDDPSTISNLIEEALRLSSPVLGLFRVPTEDVELAGASIGAGSLVTTLFAAANRDPAVFADPETFRCDRANARDHVAFGSGIHRCVGAALAKATARACLEKIFERYVSIDLLPTCAEDDHGTIMMRGRRRMPVVFTDRPVAGW